MVWLVNVNRTQLRSLPKMREKTRASHSSQTWARSHKLQNRDAFCTPRFLCFEKLSDGGYIRRYQGLFWFFQSVIFWRAIAIEP